VSLTDMTDTILFRHTSISTCCGANLALSTSWHVGM